MKKFVQKIISQTKANYNIIAPHFSFTREKIWPELIAFCQEIPSKLKVLDLGCGNGRLYKLLKTKEVDYLGIDFSKNLVKEAKKRHPQAKFKIADITAKKTWKNLGKFDLVFCIAVLHHLPTKALRKWVVKQVYQVLKPNAKVFVTVWNLRQKRYLKYHFSIDSLKLKWQLRDIGNVYIPYKFNSITVNRFLHAFNLKELVNLFEESGFEIEKSWSSGRNLCVVGKKKVCYN